MPVCDRHCSWSRTVVATVADGGAGGIDGGGRRIIHRYNKCIGIIFINAARMLYIAGNYTIYYNILNLLYNIILLQFRNGSVGALVAYILYRSIYSDIRGRYPNSLCAYTTRVRARVYLYIITVVIIMYHRSRTLKMSYYIVYTCSIQYIILRRVNINHFFFSRIVCSARTI